MRKLKIFTLLVVAILCMTFAFACSDKEASKEVGRKPSYPIADIENAISVETSNLELDESKLFYTNAGISNITYAYAVPEKFASLPTYDYSKKGVKFDANFAGAQVYYNQVLDLNSIQDEIITFEVLKNDTSTITGMEVELIDIYDADNSFKITWQDIQNPTVTYIVVTYKGVSKACNNESTENFGKQRLQYGAVSYLSNFSESFISWFGNGNNHAPFHFYYDNAAKQIRADVGLGNQQNFLLMDLDNPIHMGNELFGGFTTGEVYLKLSFTSLTNSGSVIVTSVGGQELSAEKLTANPVNDIKVLFDNFDYASTMPCAKVNAEYPVPSVMTSDMLRGETTVGVTVLGPDGKNVKVENGKFIPTTAGTYTLIYSGADVNDNFISKRYFINALDTVPALTITSIDEDTTFNCFEDSVLPIPVVNGGSGIPKVTTTYSYKNISVTPDEVGRYVFDGVGTLTMDVTATDYLGNTTTKSFNYQIKEKASIFLKSAMPKYVQKNTTFYAPDFYVADGNGTEFNDTAIYIDGSPLRADRKIEMGSSDITLTYYSNKGKVSEISETFEIKAINPFATSNASSLFIGDGATVSQADAGVLISSPSVDNEVAFANPLSADALEIHLKEAQGTYEYVEVTLTDAVNTDKKVAFRIYNNAILTENFRIQNEKGKFDVLMYPISDTVAATERKHVFYNNFDHSVYNVNNVKIAELKYCTDGTVFKGFESGVVNLSISFGGAASDAEIYVAKLGNQLFDSASLAYGDLIAPQIAFAGYINDGVVPFNTELNIPVSYAVDVLSLNAFVEISLTAPDGTKILNGADSSQARTFKLDKLGNYVLLFRAEDVSGKVANVQYNLTVVDKVGPTLTVEKEYEKTYDKGTKIILSNVSVTDDVNAPSDIYTYVTIANPEYTYSLHKSGDEFTFDKAGLYRILHCARDLSGNYTIIEYKIVVQ